MSVCRKVFSREREATSTGPFRGIHGFDREGGPTCSESEATCQVPTCLLEPYTQPAYWSRGPNLLIGAVDPICLLDVLMGHTPIECLLVRCQPGPA
ncbi:hypothetical protein AVEN_75648-1 [Araneus ventricosus]|uniref:Uncharacterized protein n=1 Tax=Araneus ventricosus TaxID=182803 RepID=A0A4Y2D4I8_ARAVE|nr:hypothetical protein AVEN_75648-1 [Araneus ventricosus]